MKKMTREQARKELEDLKAHAEKLEQARKELEDLKAHYGNLEAFAEKLEVFLNEPEDVDWFEISDGENVLFIDPIIKSGCIRSINWRTNPNGDGSRSCGFRYPEKYFSEDQVKAAANKVFAYARLYQLSLEANAKHSTRNQAHQWINFVLAFNCVSKKVQAKVYHALDNREAGRIVFTSREAAEYAYGKLEDEHKVTLFGGNYELDVEFWIEKGL